MVINRTLQNYDHHYNHVTLCIIYHYGSFIIQQLEEENQKLTMELQFLHAQLESSSSSDEGSVHGIGGPAYWPVSYPSLRAVGRRHSLRHAFICSRRQVGNR